MDYNTPNQEVVGRVALSQVKDEPTIQRTIDKSNLPTGDKPIRQVNYLNIFYPRLFNVAGKSLLPLSIGHLITFEKYKVDYRLSHSSENGPLIWNLVLSTMICSRNWKQNKKLWDMNCYKPKKFKRLYNWNKFWLVYRYNLVTENDSFVNYLNYHLQNYPETYLDDKQSKYVQEDKPKGSPLLLSLVTSVVMNCDEQILKMYSVDCPLDLTLDGCLWLFAVKQEQDGLTNIDQHDNPEFDDLKKEIAELKESGLSEEEKFKKFMGDDFNNL